MTQHYNDFKREILNLNGPRKTNNFGTYDVRCVYRSLRKKDSIVKSISEKTFSDILKRIGEFQLKDLLDNKKVILPYDMGELQILSATSCAYKKDGQIKTSMAINWNETIKLWYKHPEYREKKVYVKFKPCKFFKLAYSTYNHKFKNSRVYSFYPYKGVRKIMKDAVLSHKLTDAYSL